MSTPRTIWTCMQTAVLWREGQDWWSLAHRHHLVPKARQLSTGRHNALAKANRLGGAVAARGVALEWFQATPEV